LQFLVKYIVYSEYKIYIYLTSCLCCLNFHHLSTTIIWLFLVLDRFCCGHVENSKTKLIFLYSTKNRVFFAKVKRINHSYI